MENEKRKNSCIDCVWYDPCEDDELCNFFDNQMNIDDKIETDIEIGRQEYRKAFRQYMNAYVGIE